MTPTIPSPCVAVAIATHRREAQLQRLLAALGKSDLPLTGGIFVADNASSPETRTVCEAVSGVAWLPRSVNNGPGPAWNTAAAKALENPDVTHVLVLDDDVVLPAHALNGLLAALVTTGAAASAALSAAVAFGASRASSASSVETTTSTRSPWTPKAACAAAERVPT